MGDRAAFLIEWGATDYLLFPLNQESLKRAVTRALSPRKEALVEWTDKLLVGLPAIDAHHKHLVMLINELHLAVATGKGLESEEWVLAQLIDYTNFHFTFEENLLENCHFPDLDRHRAAHAHLKSQVDDLKRKYDARVVGVTVETLQFLKTWLSNHILGADLKYVGSINHQ